MTSTVKERNFSGPFEKLLTELSELIDWLHTEHDKSFVRAGDDKVFAFGGDGYILVLDESKWDGLIEMVTPNGGLTIKPDESGKIGVTAADKSERSEEH